MKRWIPGAKYSIRMTTTMGQPVIFDVSVTFELKEGQHDLDQSTRNVTNQAQDTLGGRVEKKRERCV